MSTTDNPPRRLHINYGLFDPPQTKQRRFTARLSAGDFLLLAVAYDGFEPSQDFTKIIT